MSAKYTRITERRIEREKKIRKYIYKLLYLSVPQNYTKSLRVNIGSRKTDAPLSFPEHQKVNNLDLYEVLTLTLLKRNNVNRYSARL